MSITGLFDRIVTLEIGPPGVPGVLISGLRIAFNVKHSVSGQPSKGRITVYGASPSTVGLLRTPGAVVRLRAGYEGIPKLIFQGTPVKGGIQRDIQGSEQVLSIDAADGGRAFVGSFINLTFAAPTTFGQILDTVLARTQWGKGFINVPLTTVMSKVVLFGRAPEILDRLARSVVPSADWYVRDNALYMVLTGTPTPDVAPVLSSIAGNLISSPVQTKKGVRCKALLDATMRGGRQFVVQSVDARVNGTYIARDVTFSGDSYADPFYMVLEGRPVGAL